MISLEWSSSTTGPDSQCLDWFFSEFSDQCLRDTVFFWCEFLFYGECDDCNLQKGEYPTYFLADLFVFLLQHQATIPKKLSDSNNHPGCSRKVLQQLGGGHFPMQILSEQGAGQNTVGFLTIFWDECHLHYIFV